jgi:ATP-dependent Clp protease protease subunit
MDLLGPMNEMLSPHGPIIYIRDEIDMETAAGFREAVEILEYERYCEFAMIEINSPGGEVDATLEIINIMRGSSLEFATYNVGQACSGAALILSAGTPGKRFMSPLSTAMVHDLSTGSGYDNIAELKSRTNYLDALNGMLRNLLASNCGISVKELEKRFKASESHDLFLLPQEAKDFGLVDFVAIASMAETQGYQIELDYVEAKPDEKPVKPQKKAPTKKPARTPRKK